MDASVQEALFFNRMCSLQKFIRARIQFVVGICLSKGGNVKEKGSYSCGDFFAAFSSMSILQHALKPKLMCSKQVPTDDEYMYPIFY